jgi:GNAT superfamily N-acetyltransferase
VESGGLGAESRRGRAAYYYYDQWMIPVDTPPDNEAPGLVSLRRATQEDAASLAALRHEFRAPRSDTVEPGDEFLRRCTDWMRARLHADSWWRAWVAEWRGDIVGAVWLQLVEKIPNPVVETERHGYVSNLFVRESVRNRGVGSLLLRASLDECAAADVDNVILWPTPESRSLYCRHGFSAADNMLVLRR